LVKAVQKELDETLAKLSGKGKGAKSKLPRGPERRKMWDDVKALRKELSTSYPSWIPDLADNCRIQISHQGAGDSAFSLNRISGKIYFCEPCTTMLKFNRLC
jgi:hypothetical protein